MTAVRISDEVPTVIAVPFGLVLRWLSFAWEPGQHFALVGPTGEGKTTFAVPVLKLRSWVMALDPKGEDPTLTASGFSRITSFPLSRRIRNAVAEGKPVRLIIGGSANSAKEEAALRKLMDKAIRNARWQGGWTVYADEFQILADLRMFGLGKPIEQGLVSARAKGTSIMTSFQAPAWVPKAALRQASFVAMWPTRDVHMIKTVAESMGREWQEVVQIIRELPPFHILIIPKSIHKPMIITHPPKLV